MYRLSSTLRGHEQDVRGVVAINDETVASVSRDGSMRVWTQESGNEDAQGRNWTSRVVYTTDKFLNCICYDHIGQILYFGGKDSLINGCALESSVGEDPRYTLIGHHGNVCSVAFNELTGEVISGSWDKTGKVWFDGSLKHSLEGHTASVWDAKFVPGELTKYITVSADKSIKVWDGSKLERDITNIHTDVIRHVEFLPNSGLSGSSGLVFATCSNDGTIKVLTLDGKVLMTLLGHESFVYSLRFNSMTNELISCGEDRSLRIWDLNSGGKVKQVIRLPALSLWCVDILKNGDIMVGGSDATIRIFSRDSKRWASPEELEEFQKQVESTTLNSQSLGFDESKVSPYEVLQSPGKREGQIVVVRAPNGTLEAHNYSNGHWQKVGEVVGSSGAGSDKKVEYEGKYYDYVFDVDIEEGKPPLKLPVNTTDNPYTVADNFILRHELPLSYREQIVQFIIKNTSGISLGQNIRGDVSSQVGTTGGAGSGAGGYGGPQDKQKFKILPIRNFLSLSSFKVDTIFSGIIKLNEREKTLTDVDIASLGTALNDLGTSTELLYNFCQAIRTKWKNNTPAYDILRLIVYDLPEADNIAEFVEEGLGNKNIVITMLTVRVLVNCFSNKLWGIQLMSSPKVYSSIFETIDTIFPDATERQHIALAVSVATLILNYSVLIVRNPQKYLEMVPIIAEALNGKFGPLEEYQNSEEVAYRLVAAYGNLAIADQSLRRFTNTVPWLQQVKRMYGESSPRFKDLFDDLDSNLS